MQVQDAVRSIIPWLDGLSIVGVIGGTAKAFEWLDGLLNDSGRVALTRWLKNVKSDAQFESWSAVFPKLIDRVFGPCAVSRKFMIRSCIASCASVTIMTLIYKRLWLYRPPEGSLPLMAYLIWSAIFNFLPDYLSLLVSRAIVGLMSKDHRFVSIVRLLFLDVAITALISLVSLMLSSLVIIIILNIVEDAQTVHQLGELSWEYLKAFSGSHLLTLGFGADYSSRDYGVAIADASFYAILGIYFYSAFFTSIWVWLYVLSGFLIKALRRVGFLWKRLLPFLDIDKKPLGCIGKVAGLLLGGLYGVFIAFLWMTHHLHH